MTPRRKRVRFALLFVALFEAAYAPLHGSSAGSAAERGMPIIELPRVESAFVDGAVLAFAQGEGGVVFVASNHLAVFDGAQWRRIEVADASRVFTLAASADGRRIWVGADGTLGYLERSPQGEWRFVSLKAQLVAAGGPDGEEVRFVFPTRRRVFFVGYARARMAGLNVTWSVPLPVVRS